jgi:hypothetical protein
MPSIAQTVIPGNGCKLTVIVLAPQPHITVHKTHVLITVIAIASSALALAGKIKVNYEF